MLESYYTQEKVGAKCRLYRGRKLRETFPWLNTNDIDMASYSLEEEGFFNTRELLEAFKRNNLSKGIKYVKGEVTRFHPLHADYDPDLSEHPGVRRNPGRMQMLGEKAGGKSYATIQTPAGKRPIHHRVNECSIKVDDWPIDIPIQFFRSVIATGSSTAAFVQQSGLSLDEVSDLPIEAGGESAYTQNFHKSLFPIQKRVRNNFLVFCPDMPVLDMPILVDPDGVVVKREDFDGHYIVMYHPRQDNADELTTGDDKVDWDLWHNVIKPKLIHRIPVFKNHEVESAWVNTVDVNTFDYNPLIGDHPYWRSISFFCGFGGDEIKQKMISQKNAFA